MFQQYGTISTGVPQLPSYVPTCCYFVLMIDNVSTVLSIVLYADDTIHYFRLILVGALLLTSSILDSASWFIGPGQMNFL